MCFKKFLTANKKLRMPTFSFILTKLNLSLLASQKWTLSYISKISKLNISKMNKEPLSLDKNGKESS